MFLDAPPPRPRETASDYKRRLIRLDEAGKLAHAADYDAAPAEADKEDKP
jgi:hypothetical protein